MARVVTLLTEVGELSSSSCNSKIFFVLDSPWTNSLFLVARQMCFVVTIAVPGVAPE